MYLSGTEIREVGMRVLLTDRFCHRAKSTSAQTDYFDETVTGLALRVSAKGVKAWTLHFTDPSGKRARITLGRYPSTSLANARALALDAKSAVAGGRDPRRATNAMTINDLAASYLEKHASTLRSGNQLKRRVERDIIPVIGNVPLAQLHRRDATRMLDAINRRGAPVEATRSFEDLRAMLRWGVARG